MSTLNRYAALGLFLGASWLLSAGCSADSADSPSGFPGGTGQAGGGRGGSAGGGPTVVDPGGSSAGGGTGRNPLCGTEAAGECLPDDARACRTFQPPSVGGAASGGAGAGGEAGGGGETSRGGEGGEASRGGAPSGGAPAGGADAGGAPAGGADAGGAPSDGDGGNAGGGQGGDGPGSQPVAAYGCQVSRVNNEPYRSCFAAGTGTTSAPCFTAADCRPGLACVTEGEAGRCLPYCCDPATACDAGSYCASRPLRKAPSDTTAAESPLVPVCVPADGCSLEDRYPCSSGSDCRCQGKTACMVVRNDGTTSCMEPGSGKQGEACPCAWNHVCSKLTNQCVQICRTDAAVNECGAQKCQASSELPGNFGFCVGPTL
jgi:hypothetical protein